MKFLLFSDVHGNKKVCGKLTEKAKEADIVIGAGDFGNMRKGIVETIGYLKNIQKPFLLVPGNAESYDELSFACSNINNMFVLHGNGMEVEGISFYGIGGGIPVTPFGSWSYDFTENQAEELLKDCPDKGVLVSHSPPANVVDLSSSGEHFGSKTIRDTILNKSLDLVVCGHIHESGGRCEYINDTPVINAGPEGVEFTM